MQVDNEFYVGDFRVDMSRSQIVNQGDVVSMEPKILQVLKILALHQGEVVTHDAIISTVWSDVVVAPNVLQRCIAKLRKAFGDSAKSQHVIATHPRIGYSLVVKVLWQQSKVQKNNLLETDTVTNPHFKNDELISLNGTLATTQLPHQTNKKYCKENKTWVSSKQKYGLYIVVLCLIALISFFLIKPSSSLPLSRLTPLTSTDHFEYLPSFSPDGRYLAFQRYVGECEQHIWAKDLINNSEYQLTKKSGIYGQPSWSPDGKQLAFSRITSCAQSNTYDGCTDLRSLSFSLAKASPQKTKSLLACNKKDYKNVSWLNNDKLVFLSKPYQEKPSETKISTLTLSTGKINTWHGSERYQPFSLAYSSQKNSLAVIEKDQGNAFNLTIFNSHGEILDEQPLHLPLQLAYQQDWQAAWHPTEDTLIVSAGDAIYELNIEGDFTKHIIPTLQNIQDPVFHPDGTKIVATMGTIDLDVVESQWSLKGHLKNTSLNGNDTIEASKEYSLLEHVNTVFRSTQQDYDPLYQPFSEQLTFISRRTGTAEIWLAKQTKNQVNNQPAAQQLTHQPKGQHIGSYIWSTDGQLIIYEADFQLHLLNVNGEQEVLKTSFLVREIYQYLGQHELLLKVVNDNETKIVKYNIDTGEEIILFHGDPSWAQYSADLGLLIQEKNDDYIKQLKQGKLGSLPALNTIKFRWKFLLKNDQLIALDKNEQLWSYDIKNQQLNLLTQVNNVKHLDDINLQSHHLLFTRFISSKRELVMFHH